MQYATITLTCPPCYSLIPSHPPPVPSQVVFLLPFLLPSSFTSVIGGGGDCAATDAAAGGGDESGGFFAFVYGLIGCFCKLHKRSHNYCIDILTGNVISMSKNISEEGAGETLGTEGRKRM